MIGVYTIVLAFLVIIANAVNTAKTANTVNSFFGVILYANEDSQAKSLQCIVQSGLSLVTQVIQSNIDSIQELDVDLLYKAKTMFKAMDYVYVSCRGRDPVEQAKQFISKLPSQLWSTVWILPEQDDGQCSATNYSKVENCDYIKKMLQQFSRNNIMAGVVTDAAQWEKFAQGQCKQVGSYPLYWFELDQNPFFTNFVPFGGWTQPKVKMYSGARICGIDIALTYRKQLDVDSLV